MRLPLALLTFGLVLSLICSCKSSEKANNTEEQAQNEQGVNKKDGPPTIVYKTKKDYREHVPVILSEDKTKIVSYPSTKDLYYKGKLAYPTKLRDGYLLDNRGVGINVAFLNIKYEKYSQLERIPSLVELYEMILDKDPLVELYHCGVRSKYRNEVEELNQLIEKQGLKDCNCLKK